MKIKQLACIAACTLIIAGCNAVSAPEEEPIIKEEPEERAYKEPIILDVNTYMEKYEDQMGGYRSYLIIDEEVASYKGSSETYFSYPEEVPFKIALNNTGNESFLFRVYPVDQPEIAITNGVLKPNEQYEKVFDGLPAGGYVIDYLIEEEKTPDDIKIKVQVELLPWNNTQQSRNVSVS